MHFHYFATQDHDGQRYACVTSTDEEAKKIRKIQAKKDYPQNIVRIIHMEKVGIMDFDSYWNTYLEPCQQKYEEYSEMEFDAIVKGYKGFAYENSKDGMEIITVALTNNGPGCTQIEPEERLNFILLTIYNLKINRSTAKEESNKNCNM